MAKNAVAKSWALEAVGGRRYSAGAPADETPPSTPTISAAADSSSQITITLVTPSTDASGIASYSLERSPNGSSSWTELDDDASFPYADSGLSADTEYFYRCRATDNATNVGSYSSVVSDTTDESGGGSPGFTAESGFTVTALGSGFAHGEKIRITRASGDFGAHADHNPSNYTWMGHNFICARFRDFSNQTLNSLGFYPQKGGSPWSPGGTELFTEAGGPANSSYCLSRRYVTGESGGLSADGATSPVLYTCFKFKQISGGQAGKFFRVYANGNQQNIYLATGSNPSNADYNLRGYSECVAASCSGASTEYGSGDSIGVDTWRLIEAQGVNATNKFTTWIDTVLAWEKTNWLDTGGNVVGSGHTLDYPNMIDDASRGGGTAGKFSYADIFIDYDNKRFVLEKDVGQKREIQIPIVWGDGTNPSDTVDAALNLGAFDELSGCTLKYFNGTTYTTIGTFD